MVDPFTLLAQEVIDLIVDEVARRTPTTYREETKNKDIVACSLVSRAFYSRAQKHILSNIHIRANEDFVACATPLLKCIKGGTADFSVPVLRSLCCAVVAANMEASNKLSCERSSRPTHHPTTLDKIYSHLGDPFLQILHAISKPESKIQHFSLVAMSELRHVRPLPENQGMYAFQKALSEACSAVSLRTIHLANLSDIPGSKIVNVFFLPCLEELTLNNLSFNEIEVEGLTSSMVPKSGNSGLHTLAPELKRLEIRNISYSNLFGLLHLPSPPAPSSNSPSSNSSTAAFPRLNSLIISLLFDEQRFPILGALSTIWSFMVTVSSTLTSLEIESYAYPAGPHTQKYFNSHNTRICLGRLSSLRRFRLTISHDTSLDFLRRLMMDSKKFPTTVESFEIKVTLSAHDRRPIRWFTEHKYWPDLDTCLISPMFHKLRRVRIFVVLFHSLQANLTNLRISQSTGPPDKTAHPGIKEHWITVFPKVSSSRSLVVDVRDVYSKNTLEAYLYASRTDDGITD